MRASRSRNARASAVSSAPRHQNRSGAPPRKTEAGLRPGRPIVGRIRAPPRAAESPARPPIMRVPSRSSQWLRKCASGTPLRRAARAPRRLRRCASGTPLHVGRRVRPVDSENAPPAPRSMPGGACATATPKMRPRHPAPRRAARAPRRLRKCAPGTPLHAGRRVRHVEPRADPKRPAIQGGLHTSAGCA